MSEYKKISKDLLKFIEESPSCYHAIDNIRKQLTKSGFTEVSEREEWKLEAGKGYFTVRNGSSLIAFSIPQASRTMETKGFHITAAHSDSPTFKIKENPEIRVEEQYIKWNVEKYGGMIMSTWMDRALSVAGRVTVADKSDAGFTTKLVNIDRDLLVIPNLAIHMNRSINEGMAYNAQVDMLPLFAQPEDGKEKEGRGKKEDRKDKKTLSDCLSRELKTEKENILGYDLFLYVREKGRILGEDGEFILSPKLDDLQCAYTTARAFAESVPREYINVCAVFDNEEVGSGTMQGADSTFLSDVLWRIAEGTGNSREGFLRLIAGSFLISADNAHAVHPNHPEKTDPSNRPYLNGGIVIKYNGNQKYTTDAVSAAVMKTICKKADVPFQAFVNRSDMAGGSTLGNISTAHVSVSSVDIGLPQLAMHSAVETAGVKDAEYAVRAFKEFFGD